MRFCPQIKELARGRGLSVRNTRRRIFCLLTATIPCGVVGLALGMWMAHHPFVRPRIGRHEIPAHTPTDLEKRAAWRERVKFRNLRHME
jgi:hypothetical protein